MSKIRPFRALRPSFSDAPDVACLPYDVMDRREAWLMAEDNPKSFLRVVRSEIELPGVEPYDERVYQKAGENLELFEQEGYLRLDETPHLYIYAQTMEGRTQRGIVACADIDEYLEGKIKKHELTRVEKELDRIRHFDVTDAHTEPVFFAYRSHAGIKALLDKVCQDEPTANFTSEDGITHTCYVVRDKEIEKELITLFSQMDTLYIADGHHRTASAVKVGLKRRQSQPQMSGEEEFNFFLAVLFDEDELMIMDYNRVVRDLNGLTEEEFLKKIRESFHVEERKEAVRPGQKGEFGMYLGDSWYQLRIKEEILKDKDLVGRLDVSLLQEYLLAPVLGVTNPRTDERIDFVGGIRGLQELERRVHTDMKVAFSFYPTSTKELFAVADAGKIMPPKSTWFEPKLRSGLFVHKLR